MRKIIVFIIYYIRWSNAKHPVDLRKINRAASNMAVGLRPILTMLPVRSWKTDETC